MSSGGIDRRGHNGAVKGRGRRRHKPQRARAHGTAAATINPVRKVRYGAKSNWRRRVGEKGQTGRRWRGATRRGLAHYDADDC